VIASGGIASIEDLRTVAALGGRVEGAVVGRALYEGLDVREALAAAISASPEDPARGDPNGRP
jgi:phosphoribosylformimino-5-aminoimidazole carboxamide ribotide isomerase